MAHRKKGKQKAAHRKKYLLETSVQIRRVTDVRSSAYQLTRRAISTSELYSSYYVLYEFKKGFIKSLIDFYFVVKLKGTVAEAKRYWLREHGRQPRQNINLALLDAALLEAFDSIPNGAEKALPQIEYLIFGFLTCFHTDLRGLTGAFASNDIVKYDIFSKDDFAGFMDVCGANTGKIPFMRCADFWKEHEGVLRTYLGHENAFSSDALKSIFTHLTSINDDIEKANTTRVSLGTADAVIATDCPKHHCVITLDHAFEVLCGILNKECHLLRDTKEGATTTTMKSEGATT